MVRHVQAEQIQRVLERAVGKLCPDWLRASQDDLVQAAMLRILERAGPGEGNPGLHASYLYKTAHSVLVDEIRRVRRRDETSLEQSDSALQSERPDPFQETAGWSIGQAVRECLSRMVEARAMGVTLYLQGHRIGEIAELLGWRTKQTDNSVYRGLADLRHCLEEKGFQPG